MANDMMANDMMANDMNDYKRQDQLSDNDIDIDTNELITNKIERAIYRYKFTEEFMEELYNFAKIHQYDHRKDFKEAWTKWSEENVEIISRETQRLIALGYKDEENIDTKMFKSARYYFRKKSPMKPEPKQRRQYISVDHELLTVMDRHIVNNDSKPEAAFILFCKENEAVLRQSVAQICAQGINDVQQIQSKIKKTYKNRYFLLIKQK
jgi:hypothetical protein